MFDSTCGRAQLAGAGACPSPASLSQCVGGVSHIHGRGTIGRVGLVFVGIESIGLHGNSLVPESMALQRRMREDESVFV